MKASPASTLRNTDPTQRIKSSHAGERKTEHVLFSVYQKPSNLLKKSPPDRSVVSNQVKTPKKGALVPKTGSEKRTKEFFTGSVVFGTCLITLHSASGFSHLYSTPLDVVVGRITTMSAGAHFMLRVPEYYSRSWI